MTYWPHPRFPYPGTTIAIRTAGDASSVIRAATAVIRDQDPNLAVSEVRTMDDVVATSVAQRRLTVQVIGMFVLVALVLAAGGIYGVIAGRRRIEFECCSASLWGQAERPETVELGRLGYDGRARCWWQRSSFSFSSS